MERIPRVLRKKQMLMNSLSGILFAVFVLTRLPDDFFPRGFSVEMLLSRMFFILYFGSLSWMILRGLVAFQSLEIDRDEIRVYFGPLLLRRIPTDAIRSVVLDYKEQGRRGQSAMYVVKLLFESPAQRRDRGERPMLASSFWIEDSPELRAALSRALPRRVCNLQERL